MRKLLRFTSSTCQPCKVLAKNLEEAKINLPIETIDIDVHGDLVLDYGIRSVPTLIMVDEFVEVKRVIGVKTPEQLREWVQ